MQKRGVGGRPLGGAGVAIAGVTPAALGAGLLLSAGSAALALVRGPRLALRGARTLVLWCRWDRHPSPGGGKGKEGWGSMGESGDLSQHSWHSFSGTGFADPWPPDRATHRRPSLRKLVSALRVSVTFRGCSGRALSPAEQVGSRTDSRPRGLGPPSWITGRALNERRDMPPTRGTRPSHAIRRGLSDLHSSSKSCLVLGPRRLARGPLVERPVPSRPPRYTYTHT